jgi:hypothetical protein
MIPLSAVVALIDRQESFNKSLVDLLGSYLERASENYKAALNPPVDMGTSNEMSLSSFTDESDDLMHQIESGLIRPDQVPESLKRILRDTETNIDV